MSTPTEPKRSKVCAVCGTESETFHLNYGASTCFSCRAFFRRAALTLRNKNATVTSMKCKGNSHCTIEGAGSRKCRRCRFEQCLRMGMKEDQVMSEDQKKCRFKRLIENQVQEKFSHMLPSSNIQPTVEGGERRKRGRKAKTKFEDLPQEVLNKVKITFKRKKKRTNSEADSEGYKRHSGTNTPSEAGSPPPQKMIKCDLDLEEGALSALNHFNYLQQQQQQQRQHQYAFMSQPPPLLHKGAATFYQNQFQPQQQQQQMVVASPVQQPVLEFHVKPMEELLAPRAVIGPPPVLTEIAPAVDIGLDLTFRKSGEECSAASSSSCASSSNDDGMFPSYRTATSTLCSFKKSSLFQLNHIEKTWRHAVRATAANGDNKASPHAQLAAADKAFSEFAAQQQQLSALPLDTRRALLRKGARRFRQFTAARGCLTAELGIQTSLGAELEVAAARLPNWFSGFVAFACLFGQSSVHDEDDSLLPILDNISALKLALERDCAHAPVGFTDLFAKLDLAADAYEDRLMTSSEELWLLQRFGSLHGSLKEVELPVGRLADALTIFRSGVTQGGASSFLEGVRRAFLLDPEVRALSPEEGLLRFRRSLPDVLALGIAKRAGLVREEAENGAFVFVSAQEEAEMVRSGRNPGINASWIARTLRQNLDAVLAGNSPVMMTPQSNPFPIVTGY